MSRRTTAYLYFLLVSIIWGVASPVVKHTLTWFTPWVFLTYRFAISTLLAIPYFSVNNIRLPKKSADVWLFILTSFLSGPVTLGLFFLALTKTTALTGSLLTAGSPLLLILAGAYFFRDRITHTEKIGITVTIFGTLLAAFSPFFLNGHTNVIGKFEGNLLMIGATIVDITAALLSKKAMQRGINASLLAQSQFIIGLALYLPLLLLHYPISAIASSLLSAPPEAHLGVLYMAIFSGTIAYTLRNLGLRKIEVSESALFSYLQPLWAGMLAVFWLHESITPSYVIGGAVIATGVIIAEYKQNKHAKQQRSRRHGKK